MDQNTLRAAASGVAVARENVTEAERAVAAAQAAYDRVRSRVDALETERSRLLASRQAGSIDDAKQGPALALISADLELLAPVVSDAYGLLVTARADADRANSALTRALAQLDEVKSNAICDGVIQVAAELSDRLLGALKELEEHRVRKGISRALFTPPRDLADLIRRLDLQQANLSWR